MAPFLNEYEILSCTTSQEGGEATIYKVKHLQLGYIRALRVLHGYIPNEQDPRYLRFLDECKLLLRIGNGGHRNIIRIFRPSLVNNQAFVEMEYIMGTDMQDYLHQCKGFMPYDEFIKFVYQISDALAYCHHGIYAYCYDKNADNIQDNDDGTPNITPAIEARLVEKYQVIHNDIHSKNVMRRDNGEYVLLDFGLAISDKNNVRSSVRRAGVYEYMAPEKFEDEGILTPQTDIYSFGILMYEMLCGEVPFKLEGDSPSQVYKVQLAHEGKSVPSIYEKRKEAFALKFPNDEYTKDYPDWIEKVILKCLEKKKKDRYADGQALFDDIKRYLKSEESQGKATNSNRTETQSNTESISHSVSTDKSSEKEKKDAKLIKKRRLIIICAAIAFLALGVVLAINFLDNEDEIKLSEKQTTTSEIQPVSESGVGPDNASAKPSQAEYQSTQQSVQQKSNPIVVGQANGMTSKTAESQTGKQENIKAKANTKNDLTKSETAHEPSSQNSVTKSPTTINRQKQNMKDTYTNKIRSMDEEFEKQKQKMDDLFQDFAEDN